MFRFKNIALYVFFFPFLSFLSHLVDFLEFFYPSHILIFALLSKWWLSQLSPCLRGRIAPNGYCSGYRLKFQTSSISDRNAMSIIKELWRWRSIQLCFCCKMNSWLGQTWPEIMGTSLTCNLLHYSLIFNPNMQPLASLHQNIYFTFFYQIFREIAR